MEVPKIIINENVGHETFSRKSRCENLFCTAENEMLGRRALQ